MIGRRPRWAWILAAVVFAGVFIVGVPAIRDPILRAAGWALVVDEPVEPADAVVVAINAEGAGTLEAADLVHSRMAPRVAVFADPPDAVNREFIRRGIPFEGKAARVTRQLESLGVTAIERIPRPVAGTEDEGKALPEWCTQRQFRSIVCVSTPGHSRRLYRVLHRAMKGHQTKVIVRVTRYSAFDPDRWWETRGGTRTAIIELQKLLLDIVRTPLP